MRTRHEHQIKRYLRGSLCESHILRGVAAFHTAFCLEWFTDQQIADIRGYIIEDAWSRYRFYRDQRRRAA